MEASTKFFEVLFSQSPVIIGMAFVIYTLWKAYQREKDQKDLLADKVITNNIIIQEQMKDMITLQNKVIEKLDSLKNG